ncbi:MAG: amidase [Gammaproteobacteria bacterium]|nr:amidase [Gammaproteobacteria bacterium]
MRSLNSPFVPNTDVHIEGGTGPLSGLTFAAKDLFDVAGYPTGAGNPDWAASHPIPQGHAWAVEQLLGAGATLIGKTITCELSLGILGDNPFYGTPTNPAAPGRYPGGSSSGSASAVAQGLCDTAIGTDTGGSVRVPASFCGLYGIRPTHGRLDLSGMLPQAPSSDTTGWFARDADTFARVSEVMLGAAPAAALPTSLIVAVDAFGIADPSVNAALRPGVERLQRLIGPAREEIMAPPGLAAWARTQRTLQPYEAWLTFHEWVERQNPRLAYSVARNLAQSGEIPASDRQWATLMREDARARMRSLLGTNTVLCMPTTPTTAPTTGLSIDEQTPIRNRIACLCSPGGLTGYCQVNLPGATADGLPVGLSIVGAPGADEMLIALATAFAEEE